MGEDELQIIKLFEDGDCALISADVAELRRIYADDFVQYDENGQTSTRADLIEKLANGSVRFLSMVSTGREVQMLSDTVALVHGSEDDEIERDGARISVRYLYMDAVIRHHGEWQIAVSQLVRL